MLRIATRLLFLAIGATAAGPAVAQVITTIAGTTFTFPSSPLPALNAPLGTVTGVAIDATGEVFVADSQNNLVMQFSPAGGLTVVAGNGIQGFSGDGGSATNASLNGPTGIAVDSAGNLYIADTSNNRIRKVSGGIITTVAGGGTGLGDGGPATHASLLQPEGVAVDAAGTLYIADLLDERIRKVSSGTITTVAGNGVQGFGGDGGPATAASLYYPQCVVVDPAGNLYISDVGNHRIRKVSGGTITTFAGNGMLGSTGDGGPATSAEISFPDGLALDSAGNLYLSDTNFNRIREVSAGKITTVAGNGTLGFSGDGGSAPGAMLNQPYGVAVDSAGNLYIADQFNGRVREVSGGAIQTIAGSGNYGFSGDGGPATSAALDSPAAVAVDQAGNIYIADQLTNRVRKVSGGAITTIAGNGNIGFSGDGGPAINASLKGPTGVAVDPAGNVYIADLGNSRVRKVSGGIITTFAGGGGSSTDGGPATSASMSPISVALDATGNLYIADYYNSRVRKVSGGIITTVAGTGTGGFSGDGGPATSALLQLPQGLALDSAGNLYIADRLNNRVRKVSGGTITTVAGGGKSLGDGGAATSASLALPGGVAVDSAGTLYIADTFDNRIRKVSGGNITTFAGNGKQAFSGDGGLATSASLYQPQGLTFDSAGNLFVADTLNNRVREVQALPPTFTVSPLTLSFTAVSGGLAPPAQTIQIAGSVTNLAFTAQAAGAPWLTLSTASGTLPYALQVSVDPSQLAAGPHAATMVITVPAASTPPISVQVSFNVTAVASGKLVVSDQSLSFDLTQGDTPATLHLTLTNQGSGSLSFTAQAAAVTGGNWISVSPAGGAVTSTSPVSLTVTANPGTLAPGTYTSVISVTTADNSQLILVPATLTVSAPPEKIALAPLGLTFIAVANGGTVLPQSLAILNHGAGSMNWTAQPVTASGSVCPWIALSASSGTVTRPLVDVSTVAVGINAQGLAMAPGSYYCLIQVSADNASNSPDSALVVLDILPAGSNPGPNVQPSGLVFTTAAGAPDQGSKTVLVANVTAVNVTFGSAVAYNPDVGPWLKVLPMDATITPAQPIEIVVQPAMGSLAPGIYRAALTLIFDDGEIRSVGVLGVVAPAGSTPISPALTGSPRAAPRTAGCTPTTLYPIITQLGAGASVPAGWPSAILAEVVDDCGNAIDSGSLVASFNNGDPPLSLTDIQNGQWSGSWTPGVVQSNGVTVTLNATQSSANLSGVAQETVGLAGGQSQPIVASQAISAVTLTPGPLAPGDLMVIQGSGLADPHASAANPLVLVGARTAPVLYADPSQVIALVPPGVPVNSTAQLAISRDTSVILLPAVNIATTHPAIWSKDGTGLGQALIYNASPSSTTVADASNPASSGSTVIIYCSGLGAVDAQGNAINVPTVSIGGAAAKVTYAGFAVPAQYPPGGAPMLLGVVSSSLGGLYQITAVVPPGLATGPAAVIISSASQSSQSGVTMMIVGSGSNPAEPSIATGGVLNAASFAKNAQGLGTAVAPGSVVAIFGSFPGATAASAPSIPYNTSLGGVTVSFNGMLAPLQGVSPGDPYPFITAQVPFEVQSGTAQVMVTVNGQASQPVTAPIVAAAPGIFTDPANGLGNAILVYTSANGTATVAAPVNAGLCFATAPIPRGTSGFFYATGLGALTPPISDGAGGIDGTTHEAILKPVVTIGGIPAEVDYYGPSGYPGVYQVNIVVPKNAPTGNNVPLVVTSADGTVTSNTSTIAIQ
jgi:uncharacterized protein (TIGR03437 family)